MKANKVATAPVLRRPSDVAPTRFDGLESRVLFSPATEGGTHMTFAIVVGAAGPTGPAVARPVGDVFLTLSGEARFKRGFRTHDLAKGVALAADEVDGREIEAAQNWVALAVGCHACPLRRAMAAEAPDRVRQSAVRNLDDIEVDDLHGFERRLVFSPATAGGSRIKFAVSRGRSGARSKPHTHPGGELVFVTHGRARVSAHGTAYELTPGAALAVPPDTPHVTEVLSEEWIVLAAYCDECPLMIASRLGTGR